VAEIKWNIGKTAAEIAKKVKRASSKKKFELLIGEFITTRVRARARKGQPLNNTWHFPNLKPSTIKARKALTKGGKHPAFSPARSNLTITGQLLDAVRFDRLDDTSFLLFIAPTKRKLELGTPPNNKQLAGYLEEKGFTIFSKKGIRLDRKIPLRIKQILLRFLRKELRK